MRGHHRSIHRVRSWLAFAFACAGFSLGPAAYAGAEEQTRGARVEPALFELQRTAGFDPAESAGLFVGVHRFDRDATLAELRFAVDDAVDLAHQLVFELGLIRPERVVLLLAGEAWKLASQERLAALLAAGARQEQPVLANIHLRLQEQALAAGARGLLVVAYASHGYSIGTRHHLAAADTVQADPATSVVADHVFEWVERSSAIRRLVFLDACRERLDKEQPRASGDHDPAKAHQLAAAISRARGQVIFSAARPGGYACESDGNGVFTAAVIDGLRCQAQADRRGFVTVGILADYVEQTVTAWGESHRTGRSPCADGIEVKLGGPAAKLPLAFCRQCLPREAQPSHVRIDGGVVEVISESGAPLWAHRVASNLVRAQVTDLNGDCRNEVVVGAGGQGADAGKVEALDHQGEVLWSAPPPREYIYAGGHGEEMSVRALETADLLLDGTRRRQTVVLYHDSLGWYPSRLSILDADGTELSTFFHPGHLHFLAIGSRTPAEPPQIFVAGVNNDLRSLRGEGDGTPAVVFGLDPRQVRGKRAEAPPFLGSIGQGNHSWYGVLLPKGVELSRLEILDQNHDGVKELCVWTQKAHVLYLDFAGHLFLAQGGDGVDGPIQFGLIRERTRQELWAPRESPQ